MPKLHTYQPAPPPLPLAPPLPRRAYSVPEAASILGIGQTNVRALIAAGRIKVIRIGAKGHGIIVPMAAIDEFLQREAS